MLNLSLITHSCSLSHSLWSENFTSTTDFKDTNMMSWCWAVCLSCDPTLWSRTSGWILLSLLHWTVTCRKCLSVSVWLQSQSQMSCWGRHILGEWEGHVLGWLLRCCWMSSHHVTTIQLLIKIIYKNNITAQTHLYFSTILPASSEKCREIFHVNKCGSKSASLLCSCVSDRSQCLPQGEAAHGPGRRITVFQLCWRFHSYDVLDPFIPLPPVPLSS